MPQFQIKQPVGAIFDCAMGVNPGDALALALLYGFDGKDEIRVASLSVNHTPLEGAAFSDAIAHFYTASAAGVGISSGRLAVGFAPPPSTIAPGAMLTEPLARRGADGKPVYSTDVTDITQTADVSALWRSALTAQDDDHAIVAITGPFTNAARFLAMGGASELIAHKVKYLVFAGGSFPDGAADWNVKSDIDAAKKVFAEWPTPIVAVGREVGQQLRFPGASLDKDFAWSPAHPVADAYRAFRPAPYDAEGTALAAILDGVRPLENYFKTSGPGTIKVSDDGRTAFTAGQNGKHSYLIVDPAQTAKIVQTWTEIASAKPVPPKPRFRRPPPDAPKPPEKPAQ